MTIDQPWPAVLKALSPGGDEAALWTAFKVDGSVTARQELFDRHLQFAKKIARRRRASSAADVELQDLYQLAFAGLLEALDRYDPATGVPFRSYAAKRISGSILDGIASMSELREQISFRNRIQRERARSLASDSADAANAMDALTELVVGLALGFMLEDAGLAGAAGHSGGQTTGYESLAWKETVKRLLAELSHLPEREQTIIRRHYLDGVSFERIAELLQLSKARVSQIHRSALVLLKKRLPRNPRIFEG